MYKVKIHGAGSIGNHLSNASRCLGWSVDLCDIDEEALRRTREDIYPTRYGAWDQNINLHVSEIAPSGGYDIIMIGTPPDHHIDVAMAALDEAPRAILIEKPVCRPDLEGAQTLLGKARELGVLCFVGYDHVVGAAAEETERRMSRDCIGDLQTIDVEFREHWGGIFNAHPWLDGPTDTYLGFWKRGGGASGEHSHAANLWQHFAHAAGAGRVVEVSAALDYVEDGGAEYDRLCLLNVVTENGLMGRIVQDVVTQPPRKWARIQGSNGFVEWHCGIRPGCDGVIMHDQSAPIEFEKTRPDDFIRELNSLHATISEGTDDHPLGLARGLDTMLVVAAAHLSAQSGKRVLIDYDKGYVPDALTTV